MTDEDLRRAMLLERYGPLREVLRERPPTPEQLARRRRVLVGEEEMRE